MEELKIQELINDLKSQDREKIDFPEFLSLVT
jgi:Ca2+-binding EF-hand superfamily protein